MSRHKRDYFAGRSPPRGPRDGTTSQEIYAFCDTFTGSFMYSVFRRFAFMRNSCDGSERLCTRDNLQNVSHRLRRR